MATVPEQFANTASVLKEEDVFNWLHITLVK